VLLIIGAVLLALWVLGYTSYYRYGGLIHIALVIGLILVVVSLLTGYRRRR
jgi:hypothetical protein